MLTRAATTHLVVHDICVANAWVLTDDGLDVFVRPRSAFRRNCTLSGAIDWFRPEGLLTWYSALALRTWRLTWRLTPFVGEKGAWWRRDRRMAEGRLTKASAFGLA